MKNFVIPCILLAVIIIALIITALLTGEHRKQKAKRKKNAYGQKCPNSLQALAEPMEPRQDQRIFEETVVMNQQENLNEFRDCAILKYIGERDEKRKNWPEKIDVPLREGEKFTIGRTDVTLGQRNNSYEFPAQSEEISRHHAAIMRDQNGYLIQDLNSRVGTFANGMKLMPNAMYRLENECEISFGTSGADYCWIQFD